MLREQHKEWELTPRTGLRKGGRVCHFVGGVLEVYATNKEISLDLFLSNCDLYI